MTGRMENEEKITRTIMSCLNTMPFYVREWYCHLKASNVTPASCRDLIYKLRRFLSFINPNVSEVKISDITVNEVERYFMVIQTKVIHEYGEICHEYTSASYKQCIWSCLKNFFDFMKRRRYISENYIDYIQRPKNNDRERVQNERVLLTKEDFNRILDAVTTGVGTDKAKSCQQPFRMRDLSIILLFMTTGMRKTALEEINVSDINFATRTLNVIDKGDITHIYPLGQKVLDAIKSWIAVRKHILKNLPPTDALFVTYSGKRMSGNSIYIMISKYCKGALGYHVSPHKLRSGFCSIMFEETGNIEFVRRAVGHANVATTQRYIVTRNTEREVASQIMNDLLVFDV